MKSKQFLWIGLGAVLFYFLIIKKGSTSIFKTPETARAQALKEPLTGLIGTGIGLITDVLKMGTSFFGENIAQQISGGVPAVAESPYLTGDIYSPFYSGSGEIPDVSGLSGYFDQVTGEALPF